MIKFGDIFRYKERYYIYLASNGETIFTARILNKEQSKELIKMRDSLHANAARKQGGYDRPIFLFVQLSSRDFESQVAHLVKTDNNDRCEDCIGQINEKDSKEILKEIQGDKNIPKILKDLTREIIL